MNDTKTPRPIEDSPVNPPADAIEQRVLALAEQLGRFVGSAQARADGWLDRQALNDQLTRIRDGAAGLLGHLGDGSPFRPGGEAGKAGKAAKAAPSATTAKPAPRAAKSGAPGKRATSQPAGRSGGAVDAPGKTHRKAPVAKGPVKKSDETIPKLRLAEQARRARRSER